MFDQRNPEAGVLLAPDWVTKEVVGGVCIGRIVGSEPSGSVMVVFEGSEPKKARVVAGLSQSELARAADNGREVLILFEQGNADRPIIVALMEQKGLGATELEKKQIGSPKQAVVDGRTVKIKAQEQIVLECGKGSITIRKDGKILIKGTNLLSRSTGPHRIKGGNVAIN